MLLSATARAAAARAARSSLTAWVQAHGTVVDGVDTGGQTLYELAA